MWHPMRNRYINVTNIGGSPILTGRKHSHQRQATPLGELVRFRRQATAGAADRIIAWVGQQALWSYVSLLRRVTFVAH